MAPEQAAGDPGTDHRADIYAWGVVAWELLGGKHPFAGRRTAAAMIAAHLSETPAALVTARDDVPPVLAALVARCLEKDPARRPQTANELLAALDQIGMASGERASAAARRGGRARTLAMIAAGVAVIAIGGWLVLHRPMPGGGGSNAERSLAVLPFESVGGDTANAYFAEGMADELTTALAKVTGLRVAATSSAFSYRNKTADVREVGKALNVSAVLQGRVRREGARMRVSAQLTNVADGIVLWSNSYERELKDVFAVQDELTRDIVGALRVTLAGGTTAAGRKAGTDTTDVDTYDLYLRGLFFLQQRGGGVARSIGYFQRALARDSTFARAWAELGTAYAVLPLFSFVPVDSVIGLARRAIASAHRLDPTNAGAFAAEGMTDLLASDWQHGVSAFERALALDSSNMQAQRAYTSALYQAGRVDESVAQARRATRADPLSPTTFMVATVVMLNADRREDALAMARRAIELDTSATGFAHMVYALAIDASGGVDSARKLIKGAGRVPQSSAWLGYLLAATGDRAGAAAYVRELEAERGHNAFANIAEAWTYLGGGDTTRALDALERGMRAHEPIGFSVPFGMPAYDAIRHSARLVAVIKGYGLDPAIFRVSSGKATPR
jgi:serine/threonine-protein kinase